MKKKDNRGGPVVHPRTLIYGWGINDADYAVRKCDYFGRDQSGKQLLQIIWSCPYFSRWASMVERCFSLKNKNPAYSDCGVHEDWKYFSNFKAWMETQDWEEKQLDKDLLVKGNRFYGPETCCFLSQDVNKFFKGAYKKVGATFAGVQLRKDTGKYKVTCKLADGTNKYLGQFENEEDAAKIWLEEKRKQARIIAASEPNPRLKEAMLNFY